MQRIYSAIYVCIALMLFSGAAAAQNLDMRLCDLSINTVAKSTFVPKSILFKIARLESGRRVQDQMVSWPWTLNNSGAGYFFASKSGAAQKLNKLMAAGKKNIDVGCMQLNIRWHAPYFNSTEAMLTPFENVSYAAKILNNCIAKPGLGKKRLSIIIQEIQNSTLSIMRSSAIWQSPICAS